MASRPVTPYCEAKLLATFVSKMALKWASSTSVESALNAYRSGILRWMNSSSRRMLMKRVLSVTMLARYFSYCWYPRS